MAWAVSRGVSSAGQSQLMVALAPLTHLREQQVHRREDDRAVAPPLNRDDGHLALLPEVHDLDEPLGLKPAQVAGRINETVCARVLQQVLGVR